MQTLAAEAANHETKDDHRWVEALRAGGQEEAMALRTLRGLLLRSLSRRLAPHRVAEDHCEDFVQEALLRIRERLALYRGESRFTTWATTIAYRIALDELRRKRWRDASLSTSDEAFEATPSESGLDHAPQERSLVRAELCATLHRVVGEEPAPHLREAVLAVLAGEERPATMSTPPPRSVVYKRAHVARRRLARSLRRAGVTAADVRAAFANA